MKHLFLSLMAVMAIAFSACTNDADGGGGTNVGGAATALMWTDGAATPSTFALQGWVVMTCDPAFATYCGTTARAQHTASADSSITFSAMPLGSYDVTVLGVSAGDLIPPYAGVGTPEPYTTYAGPRTGFLGCRYLGTTPSPVPVIAGATRALVMHLACFFADETVVDLWSTGNLTVTVDTTSNTSCGTTLEDCTATGKICARLNGSPDAMCYVPCVRSNPATSGPAIGGIPPALPCAAPSSCTLADCTPGPGCPTDSTGSSGVALDRGLCVPAP